MKPPEKLIKYSHETSVVILLIVLVVIGAIYNFMKKEDIDYTLCPLCNDSVIYYQNEGVKLPDETVTF
jgi:hypothetical protein